MSTEFNLPAVIVLPHFVYQDECLEWPERILYSFVHSLVTAGKKVFMSNAYLSKLLKTGERNVQSLLRSLEDKGYIRRKQGKKRTIECLKFGVGVVTTDDNDVQEDDLQIVPDTIHRSPLTRSTDHPYNKAYIKENNKRSCPSDDGQPTPESLFDQLWKVYPKREGKKKAFSAFRALKPTVDLVVKIIENIHMRLNNAFWSDKKFIPLLATYLNGERWNDELGGDIKIEKTPDQTAYEAAQKAAFEIRRKYNEYVQRIKTDIMLKLKDPTHPILTLERWEEQNA